MSRLKSQGDSPDIKDMPGTAKGIGMRYATLDVLRGLAALWVFTYHVRPSESLAAWAPWFAAFCKYGELGVPAFFVISGYCLRASSRSAMRRDESAATFMKRRLMRIFPPYWCSIAVVVAVPWIIEAISSVKTGGFSAPNPNYAVYSPVDWLGIVTMTRVFFSGGEHLQESFTAVNAVYWTLAIEVQFYIVMALALLVRKRFGRVIAAVTVVSLAAVAAGPLFRTGWFLSWWPMFAMGNGLYVLFERGYTPGQLFGDRAKSVCAVMLLLMTAIVVLLYHPQAYPLEGYRFTIFGTWFALAIWPMHAFDEPINRLPQHRVRIVALGGRGLLLLGAMSYSVYLLHGKVCWIAMQFVRQVINEDSAAFQFITIAVTLAMCYPFYRWCEKPFIRSGGARRRSESPDHQVAVA